MHTVGSNTIESSDHSLRCANHSEFRFYPWLVWGLAASLFFSEYFARVSPGVMLPYLMRDFHASAFMLGSLSAFFYYPYVVMQVPVGMLVDRYGPSKLITLTAILCGISCVFFANANHIGMAEISRFLMGFSASFAFVGAMKIATNWFPASRFGLLAGLTQALGMLGAAVGDAPMSLVVEHIGWRHTMVLMGAVFLILAGFIWWLVRDYPAKVNRKKALRSHSFADMFTGLHHVLKNRQSWLNAAYAGMIYAPTAAFGELWGVSFLHNNYHLTRPMAALGISLIFIGWACGGPIAGWVSDYIRKRKPLMFLSAITGFLILAAVIYIPGIPVLLLYVLLFLFGVSNTGVAIAYALSTEINKRKAAGTSLAFTNMASVIIGALFQPLIGKMLDWRWSGAMVNGIRQYSGADYRIALSVLPICLLLGIVMVYFVKETHCKTLDEHISPSSELTDPKSVTV